jgi:FkbM family methyltransferase
MMGVARWILPHGVVAAWDWARRFEAIGLRPLAAWRAACFGVDRRSLVASRLELLPPGLVRSLRTIVDVGANEGAWLEHEVNEIHAFEPNPEAFERLERRLAARPRANLHRIALGDRVARASLNVTGNDSLASLLSPAPLLAEAYTEPRATVRRQIEVEVDTLDRVVPETLEVDLLKIDVQGYEAQVLEGGHRLLGRTRAVLIEMNLRPHYEGESGFGTLFDTLTTGHGFIPWGMSPPLQDEHGGALWCDIGFVRTDSVARQPRGGAGAC